MHENSKPQRKLESRATRADLRYLDMWSKERGMDNDVMLWENEWEEKARKTKNKMARHSKTKDIL